MHTHSPSTRTHHTAPAINRGSMTPRPWLGFWRGLAHGLLTAPVAQHADHPLQQPWQRVARQRRAILLLIIALSTLAATALLFHTQTTGGPHPVLHAVQLILFVSLFAWVMAGFVTAMMGFWVQLHPDPYTLSLATACLTALDSSARTAVIMPICNEPVATVFAGLHATCESLSTSTTHDLCDVYILSDTYDPALRAQERTALHDLKLKLGENFRLYYRLRLHRTRRKAGNVADFCRRWGRNYRYMVVLDADSVMTGRTVTHLIQLMEANPQAGIIQTAPRTCGVHTLHARLQQFAGRVTGRLFTAGMQFWQLGESHYWGHNAIIRVAPFMEHCALAKLPGKSGLSGDILSHDFVEAALMRRAGYHTWLTTELDGSYEQQPSNLMEELQRDRRWCQGNLMNFRLITEPGFQPVHRAMLLTGVMSYVSAPLWLVFMLVSLSIRLLESRADTSQPISWLGMSSTLEILWAFTLTLLFLPRILAVIGIIGKHEQSAYGGIIALIKSSLLEAVLSALQAPIRMMAHTVFVVTALTGIGLDWKSPTREARTVLWGDALRRFMPVMLIVGIAMLTVLTSTHRDAIWWLLPVCLPLLLSAPLIVLTSNARWGISLRSDLWLLTPEEQHLPSVLSLTIIHA